MTFYVVVSACQRVEFSGVVVSMLLVQWWRNPKWKLQIMIAGTGID